MNSKEYMALALKEAQKAYNSGEVPVGAVVVKDGKVIGTGFNTRQNGGGIFGHAEITALKNAEEFLGDWRLTGCDIYVTLEPCPMCGGAIINSRVSRVFFGAYEKDYGSFGSVIDFSRERYVSTPEVHGGILEDECKSILTKFFESRR